MKKQLDLFLALALCLGLTACGNSDDVAGEDWRTTGVVVGSGTITHDGESDVLVEIGHEDMSNTTMLWLWAPQERYVYQPEYSSFHVPGVAGPEELIASYVGLWEYQGGEPMAAYPRGCHMGICERPG